MSAKLKLVEIAQRLAVHLSRMEAAQPPIGPGVRVRYYRAFAWVAGPRVGLRYISYQHDMKLTRVDAQAYLAWLDAGNEGKHHQALAAAGKPETAPVGAPSAEA